MKVTFRTWQISERDVLDPWHHALCEKNGGVVMADMGELGPPEECELHKTQILENGHVCQILVPDEKCEVHDVVNGATVGINLFDDANEQSWGLVSESVVVTSDIS